MKTKNTRTHSLMGAALISGLALANSANAGNIVFVTKATTLNTDWANFLTGAGHTVQSYLESGTYSDPSAVGAPLTVAQLNAADLIICDSTNGSTGIGDKASVWNALTVPLIHMCAAGVDQADWNWFTGTSSGGTLGAITSYDNTYPIWGAVDPTSTSIFSIASRGPNVFTFGANGAGGVVLAATAASSAIVYWVPGTTAAGAGARIFFAGDGTSTGVFNLSAAGQTVFLNSIDFLINPPSIAPTLDSTDPVDDATDVPISANLTATFSVPVQAGSGSVTLYEAGGTPVAASVTFDSNTVTIDPSADLVSGTSYYVLMDADAVLAQSDSTPFAGISDSTTWNFTADATAPAIAGLSPADDASNVLTNTSLTITFNEGVVAGSGNLTVHLASDDSVVDTIDVSTAVVSGAAATLTLSGDLAFGTGYYITAAAGTFVDLSGNDWGGISDTTTWSFTTIAADAIKIVWVTSARDGAVPTAWNNLLSGAGYVVFGFTGDTTPDTAQIDFLNSANLIVFDSSNGSSTAGTASVWNALTPPLINMGPYSVDNWGWGGTGGSGTTPLTPDVYVTSDPIWTGVTQPLESPLFLDVRLWNTDTPNNGGTRIAGTTGATHIARWPAGAFETGGGARMFFAGSSNSGTSDYNLDTLGETVFLNAIDSLLNPSVGGNNFSDWIAPYASGLGGLTGLNDDPDGDGIANGVENFFGTHPGEFSQGLIAGTLTGNQFTFTHPQGPLAADLTAAYRWSTDLQNFYGNLEANGAGTTVEFSAQADTPSPGFTTVTATITGTATGKLFVTVGVTQ